MKDHIVLLCIGCALLGAGCATKIAQIIPTSLSPAQKQLTASAVVSIPAGQPAASLKAPTKEPEIPAVARNIPRPSSVR